VLLLVLCVFKVSAQFYPTKIYLQNGEVMDCYAKLPKKATQKNVVYKLDIEGKHKQKLKSDDINTMIIESKNGKDFLFERNNIKRFYKTLGGEIKSTIPKRKTGNLALFYNEEFQIYRTAERYKFNRKGVLVSISEGSGYSPATFWISYKRKGEDCPTYIKDELGMLFAFGENRATRKMLEIYFSDQPEFAKRFSNKKYTKEKSHIDIAEEYMKYIREKDKNP